MAKLHLGAKFSNSVTLDKTAVRTCSSRNSRFEQFPRPGSLCATACKGIPKRNARVLLLRDGSPGFPAMVPCPE